MTETIDIIIERNYCSKALKIATNEIPLNTFIINEMNKRLELFKGKSDMDLYRNTINGFMMNFSERNSGL